MSSIPCRSHGPLSLAIALALVAGGAQAATITVVDGGDSGGTSATCMLRQAIASITAKATTGTGCFNSGDEFGSNDTIVFGNTLTAATITLTLGQLSVSGLAAPLTIQGSGQTIDANHLSRVLYAKAATLTVSSLTLTGGSATVGGGIYANNSTVTLTYSAVSGNSASLRGGGVDANNGSTVTLTNSTFSGNSSTTGNGGGVSALTSSTMKLTNSTVSGNSAFASGGGVHVVDSTVTLTDSTVSGNSAFAGGGVYVFNYGTVTFINSTVSGNSAHFGGGGFASGQGTLTLTNSTVSSNSADSGGGVYAFNLGKVNLTDSILSGNTAASLPDLHSASSSISATYSLLGTTLNTSPYSDPGNHNIFSDSPGLGALANNGGLTQTMALADNSPALNAGDPALAVDPITLLPLNYDQRGPRFPRTLPDGTIDIGAYQHQGSDRILANGFESVP